jgi:uncharacterized membrane protein
MESVLLVTFEEPGRAEQAMTELGCLDGDHAVTVRSAAIVERDTDGRFRVREEPEVEHYAGTVSGGLIGGLLGILAGPAGVLFGGLAGLLVGSFADTEVAEDAELMLVAMSHRITPGTTGVVADVVEPAPEAVDALMEKLGGAVTRRPRRDVEAEIASAEEAAQAAQREAHRVMRERRAAR